MDAGSSTPTPRAWTKLTSFKVANLWCRRRDLNPHAPEGTSPSSWRVCLFRHSDANVTL